MMNAAAIDQPAALKPEGCRDGGVGSRFQGLEKVDAFFPRSGTVFPNGWKNVNAPHWRAEKQNDDLGEPFR